MKVATKTRQDNRKGNEMRPILIKSKVINKASGSCYIEQGRTKIICSVYGPKEASSRATYSEDGRLVCDFKFAPFALKEWKESRQSNEERDISRLIEQSLSSSVMLNKFPKAVMDIYIYVLEGDGGELSLAITCASLALADSGIEMFDLVGAVTLCKVNDLLLMDPTRKEQEEATKKGGSYMMVSYLPNLNEISHVIMKGDLNKGEAEEALELCLEGVNKLSSIMRESLIEKEKENM